MSMAFSITEFKFSQAAESELRLKLRFERKLYNELREAFRTQVRNFIRSYGLTKQVPSLVRDIEVFTTMLNSHYLLVADKFANRLRKEMPKDLAMTDQEAIALSIALKKIFIARADRQSRFINKTTLDLMDRSIKFAMESVEAELAKGGSFNRMNVATSAGMLLNSRMLARVPRIACYETQWAAEISKQAEAMILVGQDPSVKAKRKPRAIKQWDAVGDSRMRDWHADADGIQVPVDQPYTVNGESLMQPGDTSLGASVNNVINCRCSSNINVKSVIGARQDLKSFIPADKLTIPPPTQRALDVFADVGTRQSLAVNTPELNAAWKSSMTRYQEKVKIKSRLAQFMDPSSVTERQRLVLAEIDKILAGQGTLTPTYEKTFRRAFKPLIDEIRAMRGLKVRGIKVPVPKKPKVTRIPALPRARVPARPRPRARLRPSTRTGARARASATPEKRAEKMVRNVGGADDAYVVAMKDEFARLPNAVTELLETNDVRIRVGKTMRKTSRTFTPSDADEVPGVFTALIRGGSVRERIIHTVSHTIVRGNRLKRMSKAWRGKVMAHETGHAFDSVLGNISGTYKFRTAIQADVSTLTSTERYVVEYYLQNEKETFAEAFAQLYSTGVVEHSHIFKKFTQTMKLIEESVAEAEKLVAYRRTQIVLAADKKVTQKNYEMKVAINANVAYITHKKFDRVTIRFLITNGESIGDGLVYIGPDETWNGWSFDDLMAIDFPNVSGEIQIPKNARPEEI